MPALLTLSDAVQVFERTIAAATKGFIRTGVNTRTDAWVFEELLCRFLASDSIEEAAFRYIINLMLTETKSIGFVDLGDDNIFLVQEYVDLSVDYTEAPAAIQERCHLGLEQPYVEYIGTAPTDLGKREVKAVIGTMSKEWSVQVVEALLARTGCPLQGSGAWVREAFLRIRPDYDGGSSLIFPESESTRWRNSRESAKVWSAGITRPVDSRRKTWSRCLPRIASEMDCRKRLCLLVKQDEPNFEQA